MLFTIQRIFLVFIPLCVSEGINFQYTDRLLFETMQQNDFVPQCFVFDGVKCFREVQSLWHHILNSFSVVFSATCANIRASDCSEQHLLENRFIYIAFQLSS